MPRTENTAIDPEVVQLKSERSQTGTIELGGENANLTARIERAALELGARPSEVLRSAGAAAERLRRAHALAELRSRAAQAAHVDDEQKRLRGLAAEAARRVAVIVSHGAVDAQGAAEYFRFGDWLFSERTASNQLGECGRFVRIVHRMVSLTDYHDVAADAFATLHLSLVRLASGGQDLDDFQAAVDRLGFRVVPAGSLASWPTTAR